MRKLLQILALGASTLVGTTALAAAPASDASTDKLLIQAQKICPVSGQALGSMGKPVKTEIDGQIAFLCCQGCVGRTPQAEHWAATQQNLAAAQGICPVQKRELPAKPASIIVEGRVVFVCCPPCTKKIKADPEPYLATVDAEMAKNLQSEK